MSLSGFALSPETVSLVHMAAVALVCVLAVVAAAWDACTFEIPDWLSIGIAALFVAVLLVRGMPGGMAVEHLMVAAAVFTGGALLFAARAFGGGDVKLLTAVALWAGPDGILPLLLTVALIGGLLCLVLLAGRALAARTADVPAVLRPLLVGEARVPYGIAIAAGTLILFLAAAPGAAGLR